VVWCNRAEYPTALKHLQASEAAFADYSQRCEHTPAAPQHYLHTCFFLAQVRGVLARHVLVCAGRETR
jgi:hypothetical protein